MARSDGLESPHASPCADFSLRARSDYNFGCRRGPVFFLLGIPSAAALDVERDGTPASSVLVLARTTAMAVRQSLASSNSPQGYFAYKTSAPLANVLFKHLHPATVMQNVH